MSGSVVKTHALCKSFEGKSAVSELELEIGEGKVFGFLGPNGAGKTTTIRMLCGLLQPTSGSAEILGLDSYNHRESISRSIGYMSQKFSLYNDLGVKENLTFYAGVYGLAGRAKKEAIAKTIEMAQLEGYEKSMAGNLSGGWRQRLALACAILHRPKLLFLDEPTSGVDPVSKRIFWDIIYTLSNNGVTVLVTTHSMDEAEHCGEIGFMFEGKMILQGEKEALKAAYPGKVIAVKNHDTTALLHELRGTFGKSLQSYIWGDEVRIHIKTDEEEKFAGYPYRLLTPTLEDLFVYMVDNPDAGAIDVHPL